MAPDLVRSKGVTGLRIWASLMPAAAAALLLAGCASTSPKPASPPPPKPAAPLDASYDWHVLVTAPFGTLLKEFPLAVHEVLLFKDEAPGAPASDDAECYAVDGAAPRFVDHKPETYLLCFAHDRLSRIEATVALPKSQAAQIFADACSLWMKRAPPSSSAAGGAGACQGSTDSIGFSGNLEEPSDDADALLSIKLIAAER
jgi:hypothetical protein